MATADLTVQDGILRDARGYPRAGCNLPGTNRGRVPANKGLDLSPTPPTVNDIVRVCEAAPDTPTGRRFVALVILLWRTGMRVGCEALRLMERDLDPENGVIYIRKGKNGKARVAPMDAWAWTAISPWLLERQNYPVGPVFCVVDGPTRGQRAWNQHDVNRWFRRMERTVGLRQRFAPHQLRHLFAIENEELPAATMMMLMGHANLKVLTTYYAALPRKTVFEPILNREAPRMMVPRLIS